MAMAEAAYQSIITVGCGTMGSALLYGWLRLGWPGERIVVIDPALPEIEGVRVVAGGEDLPPPDILLLAVKPQLLDAIAPRLAHLAGEETILVSVLAAVEIATLRLHFPRLRAIVRAVPNLPAVTGRGITALAAESISTRDRHLVEALFAPAGSIEWFDREALCDAATSISGCGPAFLFRFAEAVVDEGVVQGLPRQQALRLFAQTMVGVGAMLLDREADPSDLARRVASPGGVTRAGLEVFDEGAALQRLVTAALTAAAARNSEMTAAARPHERMT